MQIMTLTAVLTLLALAFGTTSEAARLTLENVRVVDVRDGSVSPPRDVEINDGRIGEIRNAAAAASNTRAQDGEHFDASGHYLVPGYWDMHVHLNHPVPAERWSLPLFIANGVTAVRDMDGDCWQPGCAQNLQFMRGIQRRIDRGEVLGPRVVAIASAVVNGPKGAAPDDPAWSTPTTERGGRELARRLKARGVDFIKPYDTMPRAAYFGMASEARKLGLTLSGHVPLGVSTLEALAAGQRGIEHAKHPAFDCNRFGRTFRDVASSWAAGESARIYGNWGEPARGDVSLGSFYPMMLATYDEKLCRQVIAGMAAAAAYYVPTLITRKFEARADDAQFLADDRLRFIPHSIRAGWQRDSDNYRRRFQVPAEKKAYVDFYELGVRLVGTSQAAGVRILVGTDASDSYCFPGSGLHDEMLELRRAGLSNRAILHAATLAAAEFIGMSDRYGSVDTGKAADLVILAANPLDDIANARNIAAVVRDGRLIDRAALRAMERRVEQFVVESARERSPPP